jgi:two-component system sensor histidine kinase ChiS
MGKIQDIVSRFLPFKRPKQSPGLNNRHQQLDLDPISMLVVDDDATIRKTLSAYLEDKGAHVVTANNGQEGIEKLNQHSFDLMLLDLRMPGMTGIDVLEIVRKKYNSLTLPIIMLTSCDEAEDMVRALEAGANDYVVKAGDIAVLLARIETQFSLKTMNI